MNTSDTASYRDRMIPVLQEIADRREDLREIAVEMRTRGFTDIEISAAQEAARKALWDDAKRTKREAIQQLVLELELPPASPQRPTQTTAAAGHA